MGKARLMAGVLVKDVALYAASLLATGDGYQRIRNRDEHLTASPDGAGWRCDWQWTSELHAPKHIPLLGRLLLRRALAAHPVAFADRPRAAGEPQVTFIIGHRGRARLPHLLATLRTIAAQSDVAVECIVVEQDAETTLAGVLPSWVRHVHTPPPVASMPYCRAWAFNVGARVARSPLLVLHDNDMLAPASYATHALRHAAQGYEVMNLKRFIFNLREAASLDVARDAVRPEHADVETIVQNAAGGSIAITRDAFDRIGGMDESFVGWGGEDNEFWDRAQALRGWPWGYLPLVHLWHPAQPGKRDPAATTAQRYETLRAIPVEHRIAALRAAGQGSTRGPAGWAAFPERQ